MRGARRFHLICLEGVVGPSICRGCSGPGSVRHPPPGQFAQTSRKSTSNITFNGTGACLASPCETFPISFDWSTASHSLVPGSMTVQSFGAVGNFTFKGEIGSSLGTALVSNPGRQATLTRPKTHSRISPTYCTRG